MKLEINLDQLAIIVESWLETAGLHLSSAQAGLAGARIMGYKYAVAVYYLCFAITAGFEAIPGVLNGNQIKESDRWRNWRKRAEDLITGYEAAFEFRLYISETTGKGYAVTPPPSNTAPKQAAKAPGKRPKLTFEAAGEIRQLYADRTPDDEILQTYEISRTTLWRILNNESYPDPNYLPRYRNYSTP